MTSFDSNLETTNSSIRQLLRRFLLSTLILGFGVVGWACLFKIDSAVITEGTFAVPSSAQAVQHLEGGIVGAILVKEGQLVQKGEVVARLDAAQVISDMSILKHKLIDLTAEQARLLAERDNKDTMAAPELPSALQSETLGFTRAMTSQLALLIDRRSAHDSQLSQLVEKKRQIETQIEGSTIQRQAIAEELAQINAELNDLRKLAAQHLVPLPRLRQSERDASRSRGELGDTDAKIASSRSQLIETEFRINETTRQARSEVLTQLQAVSSQIAESMDQLSTASDRIQRLEIRAPHTGYVHELAVHTVGGTVAPGQALMSIIPNNEMLEVAAKVTPDQIDQVAVGQIVSVHLTSLKLPVTPELPGRVIAVSADQVIDEKTGRGFFNAKIEVEPAPPEKLAGRELIPGLPAEVYFLGQPRTVMAYLVQPLTDKLGHVFREK